MKNKKDIRLNVIAILLMLNLIILSFIDKYPIIQVISGFTLLSISIYYLYLNLKK